VDTFLNRNGQQLGPYPVDLLKQMFANHQLLDHDLIWDASANVWRPVSVFFQPPPKLPQTPPPNVQATTPASVRCPFCKEEIIAGAFKCKHCGSNLAMLDKSNGLAFLLGLCLGPVGLWYKGHWAAGFAWLVMGVIAGLATGGFAAPIFWLGMAFHAAVAIPKV